MSREDEDRELLAWLRAGLDPSREQEDDAELLALLGADAGDTTLDLEVELRAFGLSPRERWQLLRPRQQRRATRSRHRATLRKQYRWWIDRRVDWACTDLRPDQVVGTWVDLTNYDLDQAKRWWDAGVDPVDLKIITALYECGLEPADLVHRIGSRTILGHLRRGSSVEWCVQAATWSRRRNRGA